MARVIGQHTSLNQNFQCKKFHLWHRMHRSNSVNNVHHGKRCIQCKQPIGSKDEIDIYLINDGNVSDRFKPLICLSDRVVRPVVTDSGEKTRSVRPFVQMFLMQGCMNVLVHVHGLLIEVDVMNMDRRSKKSDKAET
ncbi:hypothetical protein MGYG_06687 [Nannizzia gypsea CBS 118893]|uniref:Uncharacterized protein n=1 Tax=Arthroderma gypseum (strain ATCC MYA-4604 / CBS 118893) TaxID=535722 RepID=E4V0X6_ARTGP|nr:hypothetical protein MGYG_06687 [Nannizzia gypsea CBS 118893]EFR03691.1 hypothetical protein MGYG_06687 [Nannizzia gypsea CBS 118893]